MNKVRGLGLLGTCVLLLGILSGCSFGENQGLTPDESGGSTQVSSASRLEMVRERGNLVCASSSDLPGFGYIDEAGNFLGFEIDLCKAVAAAVRGDGNAIEVRPVSSAGRGPAIQSGEVDLLVRTVTWNTSRDAQWGNFTTPMFYDGQGFMVRADSGFDSALDLDGTTVCVTSGTTNEANLIDFFSENRMEFSSVVFEDTASVYLAYERERCDAVTSDKSQLAATRSSFGNPNEHITLPETISKEPLTPVVPHGDDVWFDIVKTAMYVLINAEELGVTQTNVADMTASENIAVRRMLGVEGSFGQSDLGLDQDFAWDVINAVGNYGEIYDRYMGPNGLAFTLPRGQNALWTNGGILYAPPLN